MDEDCICMLLNLLSIVVLCVSNTNEVSFEGQSISFLGVDQRGMLVHFIRKIDDFVFRFFPFGALKAAVVVLFCGYYIAERC